MRQTQRSPEGPRHLHSPLPYREIQGFPGGSNGKESACFPSPHPTEIFLLTLMAYDRYVAICKPLHYTVVMNRRACGLLVGAAWGGGLLHSVGQTVLVFQLPLCGPNVLDHYFCDVHPVLKLACSDTFLIGVLIIANGGSISVISFTGLLEIGRAHV